MAKIKKSVLILFSPCKQGYTKLKTEEKTFILEHILSGIYQQMEGIQQWTLEQGPQLLISIKVVGTLQLLRQTQYILWTNLFSNK